MTWWDIGMERGDEDKWVKGEWMRETRIDALMERERQEKGHSNPGRSGPSDLNLSLKLRKEWAREKRMRERGKEKRRVNDREVGPSDWVWIWSTIWWRWQEKDKDWTTRSESAAYNWQRVPGPITYKGLVPCHRTE
jgi:hypothetical protein